MELFKDGKLIPVCPEKLGGLPIPRPPAEIKNGQGRDVLAGKARVKNKSGKDVTVNFIKGAKEVLKIAKALEVKEAILKARSPSCGCDKIYDGTFTGKLTRGDGVTTALLKKNKIKVITEEDL